MQQMQIKVMVVDDSALMRKFLSEIMESDDQLTLIATARNGEDALNKIKKYKPDVLTLDIDMPKLNGIETLKRIMMENPMPVIMVSSHTIRGSRVTVEALSLGAVDFVTKPSLMNDQGVEELNRMLPLKIKEAARARINPGFALTSRMNYKVTKSASGRAARQIVAIGASTGGPRALVEVVSSFPKDFPAAVFITQHMPAGFTRSLAARLDKAAMIKVQEAASGDKILEGEAYLAPGGYHLMVTKEATTILSDAAQVNHVRPSVDVMMESLADLYGPDMVGVILTGMGRDGCEGMAAIKAKGGKTVVQDPSQAVIPSMPQAVIKRGLADIIVPLEQIGGAIYRMIMNL